jgi:hypothetical protein
MPCASSARLWRGPIPQVELAAAHYHEALTLADALGMRPLEAHCHRSFGTLYATTGQAEQARVELSTAREMYRTMEMSFWLPQVETVLAQVEAQCSLNVGEYDVMA